MSWLGERDWAFPALWGCWLAVLGLIALIWSGAGITPALLAWAALGAALGGGGYAFAGHPSDERKLVRTSPAPIVIATGATVAINGVVFGSWLFLIGAEFALFGFYLLIREGRAGE